MSALRAGVSATARVVKTTRRLVPQRAALTLTPNAVSKVKELLAKRDDAVALKIGVKTRGCNGLTYTLDYASEAKPMDEKVEQDGAKLFVDFKAQLTLLGTEMDYQQDKLRAEFVFNNPNIKGTCGCGESFNV